jgi:chemotaxis protein methyltransferase CheR
VSGETSDEFLAWVLERLELRWAGFRKVRKQVQKRIRKRVLDLELEDLAAYREFLESNPEEWVVLDSLCRITISRFHRGRGVFEQLGREVLPELASRVRKRSDRILWCWSAGSASGEEPHSLSILWKMDVQPSFPEIGLRVVATDMDPVVLKRAKNAVYRTTSFRDMPQVWLTDAFDAEAEQYVLKTEFREGVEFRQEDIRRGVPGESFDLVLCRNFVFTYFAESVQTRVLEEIASRLQPGGVLLIGEHENLPEGRVGLGPYPGAAGFYRKEPCSDTGRSSGDAG